MIDAFFQENLVDYVDTTTQPWSWRTVQDTDLGISQQVLEEFQKAFQIRDAFFPSGAAGFEFQFNVYSLSPQAEGVLLEVHEKSIYFTHTTRAPRPIAGSWPGNVGLARVLFEPSSAQVEVDMTRDGPWAVFRLLDAAEVRNLASPDRKRVTFRVGGRFAQFDLQSASVNNPFALPALQSFSCPNSF